MLCEFVTILVIEVDKCPHLPSILCSSVGLKITTPLSFACEIGNKCGVEINVVW